MKNSEVLTRYLRYMEYVILWIPIPTRSRPKWEVVIFDDYREDYVYMKK